MGKKLICAVIAAICAAGDTITADIANTTFQTTAFDSCMFSVAGDPTLTTLERPYRMSVESGTTVTVDTLNEVKRD